LIFNKLASGNSSLFSLILLLLFIFIPSVLTGLLFSILTKRKEPYSDPSSVYSADLAGSAIGFVAAAGLAIPALGIKMTIILLSTLIFAALLFGTVTNK
jgi:hypothetical protein